MQVESKFINTNFYPPKRTEIKTSINWAPIRAPYNSNFNFKGNKITSLIEKMSPRDPYVNSNCREFNNLRKIYHNLWKKLSLPENLKPQIKFKPLLAKMGFAYDDYAIWVDNRTPQFKMNVHNKSGKNKAILRHEIEHVKQIWEIIRLKGADSVINDLKKENIRKPQLFKKIKEVETTLGRISPESKEGKIAKTYVKALEEYPNSSGFANPISDLINYIMYINNPLEKAANKAAKEYQPSLFKEIKVTLKELQNHFSK